MGAPGGGIFSQPQISAEEEVLLASTLKRTAAGQRRSEINTGTLSTMRQKKGEAVGATTTVGNSPQQMNEMQSKLAD